MSGRGEFDDPFMEEHDRLRKSIAKQYQTEGPILVLHRAADGRFDVVYGHNILDVCFSMGEPMCFAFVSGDQDPQVLADLRASMILRYGDDGRPDS